VAKLLVSVRSRDEALAAVAGGADLIDVKEPLNGSLGRATPAVWCDVREVVPPQIPLSVALGELNEWFDADAEWIAANSLVRMSYCKLGLSHASPDWFVRWRTLCDQTSEQFPLSPSWVAVVYIDWRDARSPDPDSIIRAAGEFAECRGVLFDTWDKKSGVRIDDSWQAHVNRVRDSGQFVAVAGSLDIETIERLAALEPDIVAVRGAACAGGDRLKSVDSQRVSDLAQVAGNIPTLRGGWLEDR
jgi:(5-formylfuran-3-yl)methyl phosphate synthase